MRGTSLSNMANPAAEHLVGVGCPLTLMQHLEPGFDREGLDEASGYCHIWQEEAPSPRLADLLSH